MDSGQFWIWLNTGKDTCPWFVGGIAENFVGWKSMWIRLVLGRQEWLDYLIKQTCCWTDRLLGSFIVSQSVRLEKPSEYEIIALHFLRHFGDTWE